MKSSKLYSIFFNKCPKCHEGQFFQTNNPYDLKKFDKMNEKCSHCGENFTPEPGFYVGAMYVSYGISVAVTSLYFFGLVIYLKVSATIVLAILVLSIILLIPISFRLSRLIWINFFVDYSENQDFK